MLALIIVDLVVLLLLVLWYARRKARPALLRQADFLGWKVAGTTRDDLGQKQILLERGNLVARICTTAELLYLDEPVAAGPFNDVQAMERYLAGDEGGSGS